MGYRRESVSFYKGNAIYIGSNPKIRRDHRKSLERFKDKELERAIKRNFLSLIRSWFKEEPKRKEPIHWAKEANNQLNNLINSLKTI